MHFKSVIILVLTLLFSFQIQAQSSGGNNNDDILTLDFEENLNTPKIKKEHKSKIINHQNKLGITLKKLGYTVETIRNREVLIVVLPAHDLFPPNCTIPYADVDKSLKPLVSALKGNGLHKILLAMHSDNTGNSFYCDELTTQRVLAVYEVFKALNLYQSIVPYGMGGSEPLTTNDSRENRMKNRRLEIYLVPSQEMIKLAKANAL